MIELDPSRPSSASGLRAQYAQTNVQLYEQMRAARYELADVEQVATANRLALDLFSALLRPEGRPFVAHLVGTASVLVSHGAPLPVVVAGLLHAAYQFGEFDTIRAGVTPRKRRRVRDVVGEEAEELVYRYTGFPWSAEAIEALPGRLQELPPVDRKVVLLRLANELEDAVDGSLFYMGAALRKNKLLYLKLCVPVALGMGEDELATEFEASHRRISDDTSRRRPELGRDKVYSLPSGMRVKLSVFHALRNSRRRLLRYLGR